MRKVIIAFIFIIPIYLFCYIENIHNIPSQLRNSVIPDMKGRVFISDNFIPIRNKQNLTRDLPTPHEGWPISYTNSNCYNGAIYCNMDDDPEMEIIFGVGKKISAQNLDGSNVDGWPVSNTYYIWSSPACGDIDGDGINEIVATSRNNTTGNEGELYAYELDGTICNGFPISLPGGGTLNACLSDLDGDNALEIFVNVRNSPNGWVYVYHGDGTIADGWPADLNDIPGASISVADLDNDGSKEVIALSYNGLNVFDANGNMLDGFPFSEPGTTISYSQPTIYDIDSDGDKEIIYGACTDTGGKVFVFHHDGTIANGWPQETSSWIFASVALGDIDQNGSIDLVVGDQVSSNEASNFIYAWNALGEPLENFPAGPTYAIYTQAAIADIDGDEQVEIMIDDNRFAWGYECYNHDGSHNDEWPLACGTIWSSTTMMITPVLGDFNNDGYLNITGAATDIVNWAVEEYVWDTTTIWNPALAYSIIDGFNIQHDGVFNFSDGLESPSNCQAEIQNFNDIYFSWEAPESTTPESYNLCINEAIIANVTSTDYTYYAQPEGIYNFSIYAVYPDGQISSSVDFNQIEIVLPSPEFLTCDNSDTSVVLAWSFNRNFEYFKIYRDQIEIAQVETTSYQDLDVAAGESYDYYVTSVFSGGYESSPSNIITVDVVSSDSTPDFSTRLRNVYPNPFNPTTSINFFLKDNSHVRLDIYNARGNLIQSLLDETLPSGEHQINWNATNCASGIYLIKLKINDDKIFNTKALLLK